MLQVTDAPSANYSSPFGVARSAVEAAPIEVDERREDDNDTNNFSWIMIFVDR